MARYLHGVNVPHRKKTRHLPVLPMETPKSVTIPMAMHIGKPATPIVKVGDLVQVGTKIGEADGFVSVPVYSSVSGKVSKITEMLMASGNKATAVVIESDGAMTPADTIAPPAVHNREDLIAAIRDCGLVGLGGAGFPTHVKFNVEPEKIEYLIINGAECEPYVTSDTITMVERADDMARGLNALAEHMGIKNVIIGIENNKKTAIRVMKDMAQSISSCSVRVLSLPSVYPQGGEKVLVYHATGRTIPVGGLPIHVGCIVINCTTLATIGAYLQTGMPLVEKCVTVEGKAVRQPQNVMAPIGASFADLFEACGGLTEEPDKLIYGGPMMGITVPDTSAPIMTNTNAILALTKKEAWLPKTTACIRCSACTNHCPFGLAPAAISRAYDRKDAEALKMLAVDACMECGCCSFVCPANRPLVQKNKLGKQLLREEKAKEGGK
ncbi:MAG: electron transport complex subunit RsxC [Clostridia bacterium]|nr:electron transport complex subunit RsxC [Clostridia bacterium]